MRLQVLGHAGLRINAGGRELLCDPWLIGSCYWRSWWNYPPVPEEVQASVKPDFVYLTHLHWDHFHGPSLRSFSKETKFVVPYLRYDRMVRDLAGLGFTNVVELRHGARLELAKGLALRSYQIGPIFTDSAVVIEADDRIIFNANDAKLAGLPLTQILRDYPRIDFCLRSHSSANARRCMHLTDEPGAVMDEDRHYTSSFSLFMKRVRPRFAIPFASNACFLHRDSLGMNVFTQTPLMVKAYFDAFAEREKLDTQLVVMVSGDEWSTEKGFSLTDERWFEDKDGRLLSYAAQMKSRLEQFYAQEGRVRVTSSLMEKYFTQRWKRAPWLVRRRIAGRRMAIVAIHSRGRDCFELDLSTGRVTSVAEETSRQHSVRAEFPAMVLAQSIRLNMFSQAWISKRVHYHSTREDLPVLQGFLRILELSEAELLPWARLFTARSIRAWLPRWRELHLYAQAAFHLLRRRTFVEIEARLLQG